MKKREAQLHHMGFLATDEERETIRKDAYKHGMRMTAYILWLAKKEHEKMEAEK